MSEKIYYGGIDCGALYCKLALFDEAWREIKTEYRAHHGRPEEVFYEFFQSLPEDGALYLAVTGGPGKKLAADLELPYIDYVRAEVAYAVHSQPEARYILHVGGANATWIELDAEGAFTSFKSNSMCAAGTGSFLDEQAARLGINYASFTMENLTQDIPLVATRCAVFAKSDLIHFQQQGYVPAAMWAGLCRSMAATCLHTLIPSRKPEGLTIFTGGVSQNIVVLERFREILPHGVVKTGNAHLSSAIGAALIAKAEALRCDKDRNRRVASPSAQEAPQRRKPLVLHKTKYPASPYLKAFIDEQGNEVNVSVIPTPGVVAGYLGVDIGSTSTKLAFLDPSGRVVVDIYRKTSGNPIAAVRKIFTALEKLFADYQASVKVLGCGTTGSGRKMVGLIIGADEIVNEISAHAAGARNTDPTIDTIFEIGGQDSKYVRMENGQVADSNMNYVCAAGTGSFIEELAHKLHLDLFKMGEAVLGTAPPFTSERCTVFMEQDCNHLIRQGFGCEEVMGAILYSVARNYLNRVVGRRYYSRERIFFQGATARNQALVAAMENLLDVEIVVSPYCGVMGAVGVALLLKEKMEGEGRTSSFIGLDLSKREITFEKETCKLCNNSCVITSAVIEGRSERPSWGYMCGREPEETKVRRLKEYTLYAQHQKLVLGTPKKSASVPQGPVVGVPLALSHHAFLPFWREFLSGLDVPFRVSRNDGKIAERGGRLASGDFCFPVKAALGHVAQLKEEGVDFILTPHLISTRPDQYTTNNFFCPYVQSFPSMAESAFRMNKEEDKLFLSPIIDFRWPLKKLSEELYQKCGSRLNRDRNQVRQALFSALIAQRDFHKSLKAQGRKEFQALKKNNEIGIVILARPYTALDPAVHLEIPRKLAAMGFPVFSMETLPWDDKDPGSEYTNMYWNFPRQILCALNFVNRHPNLYPVYLTNFNCGPDSFTLTYAEKQRAGEPMLILELDEHGADVGYLTRMEAFVDVIRYHHSRKSKVKTRAKKVTSAPAPVKSAAAEDPLAGRKIWVPQMHPISSRLGAAAFRSIGLDCEMMPLETRESYELGRRLTRGSECLPNALTIGSLVHTLNKLGEPGKKHAYFMPTAEGPCRFGQYATLHRQVLDKCGYPDVHIISPTSLDTYGGLIDAIWYSLWTGFITGDLLMKMACRVRPYEMEQGKTNIVLERGIKQMEHAIEKNDAVETVFRKVLEEMAAIPQHPTRNRPLVGIVGEIYVRANTFANENVIAAVESFGGEAWLAPMSEWLIYTAFFEGFRFKERYINHRISDAGGLRYYFLKESEHQWHEIASPYLDDRHEPPIEEVLASGEKFITKYIEGEAVLTVGRALQFIQQGASMIINCAPFGCMPGTISTALHQEVQARYGVPILNLFYDGEGLQNEKIAIFLSNLRRERKREETACERHERVSRQL